jgi:F0F1-type ATP synthase membrane subunit b/b'
MSSSRIEQIIEEIEEYVENCRYQPLSTTKIIVNKEELEELLRELRLKTPDEIKRYQKIIGNKDAILADAQSKANNIIEDAKKKAQQLVQETEIMKAAYAQANDTVNEANKQAQGILDSAESDADNIRSSAINYTDQILSNISTIMGNTIADVGEKYNEFATSIQSYYDLVNENRSELSPMQNQVQHQTASDDDSNDKDEPEDADNE